METQRVERRLSAVLAADVAGYGRLVGVDEEGTLAQLRSLRAELIDPAIATHRIIKTTGDGILVDFPSVVDAGRCALDVQRGIAQRNADIAADRRIVFRIGIHLGDVVVDGSDLLGDAVNIAARLEGIAEPGGVNLSEDAWRQVRDKLPEAFVDLGEQSLKNIARPVGAAAAPQPTQVLPDKPSIAVLPFQNISGDPEQEYFTDGMVVVARAGRPHRGGAGARTPALGAGANFPRPTLPGIHRLRGAADPRSPRSRVPPSWATGIGSGCRERAGDRGRTGDVQLGKLSGPLWGKGFSAAVAEMG